MFIKKLKFVIPFLIVVPALLIAAPLYPYFFGCKPISNPVSLKEETVKIKDLNVYYLTAGDSQKQPLVLLHGTGGTKKISTCRREKLITELSSDFYVYYPLHPGFSKSELPRNAWSTEDYADYVNEFINQLHIEQPVVVGQSFGGRIALEHAVLRSQNIKLLVLGNAAVRLDTSKGYQNSLMNVGVPVMNTIFTKQWVPTFIKSFTAHVVFGIPSESVENYTDLDVMVKTVEKYKDTTFNSEELQKVTAPTVIIWGKHDQQFPIEIANTLDESIKDSELHLYDAAHTAMYEDVEKTKDIILERLKKIE